MDAFSTELSEQKQNLEAEVTLARMQKGEQNHKLVYNLRPYLTMRSRGMHDADEAASMHARVRGSCQYAAASCIV